jgi:hypothetical protein
VVDRDDRQLGTITLNWNANGRLVEGGVDVVDRNGVVWVRCVAADIADDTEPAVGRLEALLVDEWWDGFGEVDTVDEDVWLDDLRVWAVALLGLGQIPLLDFRAADLLEQVNSTGAASSESTKYQTAGLVTGDLLTGCNILFELGNQLTLVVVVSASVGEGLDTRERLTLGVGELPCPCLRGSVLLMLSSAFRTYLDGKSSPHETSVIAERSNAPAWLILQEFKVVQCASSAGKPRQNVLPAALLLVAMREVDKCVLQRELVLGQLLQSDDDPVLGRVLVCAFLNEGRACLLELLVLEDAGVVGVLGRALDEDRVASIEQLLCGGRCETRSSISIAGYLC